MALTPKQARFVDVYAGNATEACRLAGYKGTAATLGQVGLENLKKPEVVAALKARQATERQPLIATRQQRQAFWSEVMSGSATVTLADGTTGAMPVEMRDRLKASELLGKSEADFVDKVEHSGGLLVAVIDPYAVKPED